MCGIAGIIQPTATTVGRHAAVEQMCRALVHRGPDDKGITSIGDATLGMRRLAIFDPANGRQPMQSPDGRLTLVFNGAIYNFRELRRELAAAWDFRTECDTEVLLAAFARWGGECLPRLRGMFAFAVWDATEQSLFFARDAFGIKPLYYRHHGATLVFASELRALLASGRVSAEIDPHAVAEFLAWQSVPAPRTIYRGIASLRAGECATFRGGKLLRTSWWHFPSPVQTDRPARAKRADEFHAELRAKLDDTMAAHCLADVPVGAFLSGGLDSAVIAGLMARHTTGRLKTFSIGFEETGYSEADAAAATASHIGAQHSTTILRSHEVANDIERIISMLDHPTGDGINTYYASRAARAGGVTVALSGLGGDELFGGYPSFRQVPRLAPWLNAWRMVPAVVSRTMSAPLAVAGVRGEKLADLLVTAHDRHALAAQQRRVLSDRQCRRLLASAELPAPHPELDRLRGEVDPADLFALASAWELRGYMTDLLLRDSDAMSMAHSLELRVPLVDLPLIEWLWQQPSRFKNTPAQPKSALATAARDVLPPALLTRAKRGFTLPFPLWMRGALRPWLRDVLSPSSVNRSALFDVAAVQSMSEPFFAGHDDRAWSRVWSTAVLIAFVNRSAPPIAAAA